MDNIKELNNSTVEVILFLHNRLGAEFIIEKGDIKEVKFTGVKKALESIK